MALRAKRTVPATALTEWAAAVSVTIAQLQQTECRGGAVRCRVPVARSRRRRTGAFAVVVAATSTAMAWWTARDLPTARPRAMELPREARWPRCLVAATAPLRQRPQERYSGAAEEDPRCRSSQRATNDRSTMRVASLAWWNLAVLLAEPLRRSFP